MQKDDDIIKCITMAYWGFHEVVIAFYMIACGGIGCLVLSRSHRHHSLISGGWLPTTDMQRSPSVFRVASSLCPMRVRSRSVLKRVNAKQYREAQAEKNEARRILESGPVDLNSLQLNHPPTHTPEFVLKNGWCPPPETLPDLPFQVTRTAKGGFIPVYRDVRNGRTRIITVVKKASGDMEAFTSELSKVCQGGKVEARGGELRVEGDHATNVKRWLSGLGF